MSLETAHVKEAEALSVKTESGEVCVKTEPGELCVKTEPGEVCVKTEPGEVCVKTEPEEACVKEERECEDSVLRGVNPLHTDHEVKDELVLGPEEWHHPKGSQDDMLQLNMAAGGGASDEGQPLLCEYLLHVQVSSSSGNGSTVCSDIVYYGALNAFNIRKTRQDCATPSRGHARSGLTGIPGDEICEE
ncbi:uncharacterized protein LOC134800616 [Cydia splendana]|uniref:uncharacterized protein LOC134800616 n=1 Tax=Cydia splendana TaxID=1100963 RepID=UPI00300C11CA